MKTGTHNSILRTDLKIKKPLVQGVELLCRNDRDIENLINVRFEEIIKLLERYIKEIELFNPAYGLISVNDSNDLITRHILDSIAPLGIIFRLLDKRAGKIADAGSGAGLPGIPLAITMPDTEFTLIERMTRRTGFLFNIKAVLGITNVIIKETEITVLNREKENKNLFSIVTFRAFLSLKPRLLKTLLSLCSKDGLIAAYKGKREKTEAEMIQYKDLYNWELIPYKTPFLDEERHILVVRAK